MHTLAVCREGNVLYVQPMATCCISLLGSMIFNVHIVQFLSKPGYKDAFRFLHSETKTYNRSFLLKYSPHFINRGQIKLITFYLQREAINILIIVIKLFLLTFV